MWTAKIESIEAVKINDITPAFNIHVTMYDDTRPFTSIPEPEHEINEKGEQGNVKDTPRTPVVDTKRMHEEKITLQRLAPQTAVELYDAVLAQVAWRNAQIGKVADTEKVAAEANKELAGQSVG